MPVFGFMDDMPIRVYDESRLAINAYEMTKTGQLLRVTCGYHTDYENMKPPLMIWLQAGCMKMFGAGEIAVRLPTAFAAFFTCIILLVFCEKYLGSFWLGFIAVVALITTNGYIHYHVARSGDYDTMLTCFTTLSALLFFVYCETEKTKWLYLFFAALTFAFFTKGIASLLFSPAYIIYALMRKRFLPLLTNKHFYLGMFGFLGLACGYYAAREYLDPGYFWKLNDNELVGRYFVGDKTKSEINFRFYYDELIESYIYDRYFLIPCGFVIGFFSKNKRLKQTSLYLFIVCVTFYIILSIARTQLYWYDAPLYPLLSIFVALFVHWVFDALKNASFTNYFTHNAVPYVFLFLVILFPYQKIWHKTYKPGEIHPWDKDYYALSYFLKEAVNGNYNLNNAHLLHEGYRAHCDFYTNILNDRGVNVDFKDWHSLVPGDTVIAFQQSVKDYLCRHYRYTSKKLKGIVAQYSITEKYTTVNDSTDCNAQNETGKKSGQFSN